MSAAAFVDATKPAPPIVFPKRAVVPREHIDLAENRAADADAIVGRALEAERQRLEAFWHPAEVERDSASLQAFKRELQRIMWKGAGPLRTEAGLTAALAEVRALRPELDGIALARPGKLALPPVEKLETDHMLKVAEAIVIDALQRRESRGAHVRLDYEETLPVPESYSLSLDREKGGWTRTVASPPASV